jgi:hypothetical protein
MTTKSKHMDESALATLDVLYETYAADARRDWEEKGKPGKHAFWAWERIQPFLEMEKERLQNPAHANISDALFDASARIKSILLDDTEQGSQGARSRGRGTMWDRPRYAEKLERIEAVLSQMDALRAELDAWGE